MLPPAPFAVVSGPYLSSGLTWRVWARYATIDLAIDGPDRRTWYSDRTAYELDKGAGPLQADSLYLYVVPDWAAGDRFTIRFTLNSGSCSWRFTTRQTA